MAAKMMMIADAACRRRGAIELRAGGGAFAAATPARRRPAGLADADPGPAEQPSRLSAPKTASMMWRTIRARIRPAKKNRPAPSSRGRKAKTSLVRGGDRGQHARQAERLQRGDQTDQPDEPVSEPAELVPIVCRRRLRDGA